MTFEVLAGGAQPDSEVFLLSTLEALVGCYSCCHHDLLQHSMHCSGPSLSGMKDPKVDMVLQDVEAFYRQSVDALNAADACYG